MPAALAREFNSSLDRGPAFAILKLAARHPAEALPPSVAFFRDLGGLFLARACAAPEAASHEAPADELSRLLSQAPPMAGGEYFRPAIDEYRLVLCPVVLGGGRPLLREQANLQLKLAKARAMDLGAVSLVYARR